jgi:hypothetical protein
MSYVDCTSHENESPAEAYERRRQELEAGWKVSCVCSKCEEGKPIPASEPLSQSSASETVVLLESEIQDDSHKMEGSDVITVEHEVPVEQEGA